MSSDSGSDSDQGAQIRVSLKLAASVSDRSLEVPAEPIAVPADVGRKGLAAVLNHLLGRSVAKDASSDSNSDSDSDSEDDDSEKLPPLAFEFILSGTNNRLLRKGVEKEARQHGVSLEEALSITYFPAANVPEVTEDEEVLPDWVSCLSYDQSILCSGCYDGTVHLYKNGSEKLGSALVATGPIKCLNTMERKGKLWIASASLDHNLHFHTYDEEHGLQTYAQGMQDGLSCAMSSLDLAKSQRLASGDGNGCICVWDITKVEESSSEPSKKRKTTFGSESKRIVRTDIVLESAHSQLVSGVSWGNHSTDTNGFLISGSWDHSIKLWDVEKQDCLLTLNGSRVVSCLDTSYHSEGVVATGHPDCTIRLWDVRTNTTNSTISDNNFRPSHRAWVSSVQWSKSNAYHLASCSHDGTVKLWDIRSSNPLHTVRAFAKDEKALCLIWENDDEDKGTQHIFSGGTDCTIKHLRI